MGAASPRNLLGVDLVVLHADARRPGGTCAAQPKVREAPGETGDLHGDYRRHSGSDEGSLHLTGFSL